MAAERPSSRVPASDLPAERSPAESLAPYLPVLSPSSREALARANGFRLERRSDRIHMEHLLTGLLMKRDGPAQALFAACGLTGGQVIARLRGAGKQAPEPAEGDGFAFRVASAPIDESTPLSRHVREAVEAALERARTFGDPMEIKSRDLLLGMGAVARCSVVRAFGEVFARAPEIVASLPASARGAQRAGNDATATPGSPGADGRSRAIASVEASLGVGEGATNDRPEQAKDRLDFDHYVRAFADLIESPDTKPPVTVGIFGSWGAGKSFLLWHVQEELRRRADARRRRPRAGGAADRRPRTVHAVAFNAWEYNAAELIWPRLVRAILENADREARGIARATRGLARFGRRLRRASRGRWPTLLTVGVVSAALASLLLQIPEARLPHALQQVFGVGIGEQFVLPTAIGALVAFGKLLRDSFVSPLGSWMTALLDDQPAYGGQIDYMRAIKDDLEHLQRRLETQHARVLVTIDDLDRCEPGKMIEVLQAVNLLLDRGSFVVCLGLDARVVTAAVEKHYEDLLGPAGMTGYEYLDKIIQIPFRIPEPTETQLGHLLAQQLGHGAAAADTGSDTPTLADQRTSAGTGTNPTPAVAKGKAASSPPPIAAPGDPRAAPAAPADDTPLTFSDDELRAFQGVTPYLRPNPRHIKRLVNVYALVRSLSALRGDLGRLGGPESVVRWLVLAAQWPYAVRQMLDAFDRIAGAHASASAEDDPSWVPAGVTPGTPALRHLLDRAVLDAATRDRYDDDADRLGRLVNDSRFVLWSQLRLLRRYTLNFNPALDAELRAARTEEAPVDRREHALLRKAVAEALAAAAPTPDAGASRGAPAATAPPVTAPSPIPPPQTA